MNRQITLASRPVGFPQESDFALVEAEIPQPGAGEVLVRAHWLSLDPYMRGRMSGARSFARPTEIGEPMRGQVVGEVVESQDARFAPGELVVGRVTEGLENAPRAFIGMLRGENRGKALVKLG